MSIQCNMCGKYDNVRLVPSSQEENTEDGSEEWPCCKKCFMSDEVNSDPPMSLEEKQKLFSECTVCN